MARIGRTVSGAKAAGAAERLRVIVLAYVVRGPLGGMTWHYLHYAAGLARLGHDVYAMEDSGDDEWCCYDPSRGTIDADPSYGLSYAAEAYAGVGLGERWAYWDAHTTTWHGPCAERATRLCAEADLLINVSAANALRSWLEDVPARALVDTDPGFLQVRLQGDAARRRLADAHTSFHTFGERIGRPDCRIPSDGRRWRPTRQPVVLDLWPVAPAADGAPWTTLMQWDSYPPREHDGLHLGMKSDSFRSFVDLPRRVSARLELAVGRGAPTDMLKAHGWHLRDPLAISSTPWSYKRWVEHARGELSVAKAGYVLARSGWFSERSANFLAAGRPVVLQDTGFSELLPVGEGLLAFDDADEAAAALEDAESRYDSHCRAARAIAEEHFDSRVVLTRLVEDAMEVSSG